MTNRDRVHERAILDALEAIGFEFFESKVWRVTRAGREPTIGSAAGGRWSPPGEFEVLYTCIEREGALAEIGYRLSLEPVWPSRINHEIHEINLRLDRALKFADLSKLEQLDVDVSRYQSFEYDRTQEIASAAHFLEYDGLIVPSARYNCLNAIVFLDRLGANFRLEVANTAPIDWSQWKLKPQRS